MNYQSSDKENINLMDRDSDGLTSTERQVLETFEVFKNKLPDATSEALAILVLAEKTSLSFAVHERSNCKDLKQKRLSGRSRLFRCIVYIVTKFVLVCNLIENIIVVTEYFM